MDGTLCFRHGHLPHGCSACAELWDELARTTSRAWADRVVWVDLGPMTEQERARQHEALVDGSIVYGWGRR